MISPYTWCQAVRSLPRQDTARKLDVVLALFQLTAHASELPTAGRPHVDLRAAVVIRRFDAAQRLVSRQLEFGYLAISESANSGSQSRLGDRPHLKRERDRLLRRRFRDDRDHCRAGELGPIQVGREWDNKNRLKGLASASRSAR